MRLPPSGDQEEFYHALQNGCRTESETAVIMLLWRTGMHASTLVREWYSIDREGTVHWSRVKTGKWLRATMPKDEAGVIIRCLMAGLLPNTTRTLGRWVRRIGDRAGYSGICPLTLRHSRAIWLLDAGLPQNRVASLIGCSWAVLEKHYAQIEAARLIE